MYKINSHATDKNIVWEKHRLYIIFRADYKDIKFITTHIEKKENKDNEKQNT